MLTRPILLQLTLNYFNNWYQNLSIRGYKNWRFISKHSTVTFDSSFCLTRDFFNFDCKKVALRQIWIIRRVRPIRLWRHQRCESIGQSWTLGNTSRSILHRQSRNFAATSSNCGWTTSKLLWNHLTIIHCAESFLISCRICPYLLKYIYRRSANTRSWTFVTLSFLVAMLEVPGRGSSIPGVRPRKNSLNTFVMADIEGEEFKLAHSVKTKLLQQ